MKKRKILITILLIILVLVAFITVILMLRNKYYEDKYCNSTTEAAEIFEENKEHFYKIKEAAEELATVKNKGKITIDILSEEYISSFNILINNKISSISYEKDSFGGVEVSFKFEASPICDSGLHDILLTATDMSYYSFIDLGDGWYIRAVYGV